MIDPVQWKTYIQDEYITMQGILEDADVSIRLPHTLRSKLILPKWKQHAELVLLKLWDAKFVYDDNLVEYQMNFLGESGSRVFYRGPLVNPMYSRPARKAFSNLYTVYGDKASLVMWTDVHRFNFVVRKPIRSEIEILDIYAKTFV